ncbi:BspA family leucine-rich repeat surface protein [Flagellimonas meishanensis]|uniref:BspA family leucine-rich repeat surface protein n=1 Tax=Flagellimonas meishanensis TaxID=2873264 RepID=UPI001CA609CD|nr:BspA family leucine-rich repeat surface protein [[Muricauda] meishanensis]
MNLKKLFYAALFALAVTSCGKDDGPTTPTPTPKPKPNPVDTNTVPVIAAQAFTVSENINDTFVIGTVTATDADDDALTFSLAANSDNLFEITGAGALSLAAGKTLSFATKASHVLSVRVSDGTANATGSITVNVTRVETTNETPVIAAQSFEVAENVNDAFLIGTVTATDAEEDALVFSIAEDASGLFEITDGGELSLLSGNSLDFATAAEHTLTVSVTDGNTAAQATITINVTEVIVSNLPPTSGNQLFAIEEKISDTDIIGTVVATDPENDVLTFAIVTNDNDLFEITEDGALSLATDQSLDYETATQHVITVSVTDGNSTIQFQVTINVTDVDESPASFFITTWMTTNDMEEIRIEADINLIYDFTIDWGDGTVETLTNADAIDDILNDVRYFVHTYELAGTYTVAIQGDFPAIQMFNVDASYLQKLTSIEQWGNIAWQRMARAFVRCTNMVYNATDVPDLSQITDISYMFSGATSFNGDLSNWDVGNVTNMQGMFDGAALFNGDISSWTTSSVTNMIAMFSGATSFNRDIGGWNTGSVTDMEFMFNQATSFNQDIGGWNTGSVTDMEFMFNQATSFNQDIGGWDTSNVTNMDFMFRDASAFNQDISGWNVGNVTNMSSMFKGASAFNQDINGWNVGNVRNMANMFNNASAFDQMLGDWDLSSVTTMANMLDNSGLSPDNYDRTLLGWYDDSISPTPQGIDLGAAGLNFCNSFGRNSLINKYGWTITDAGLNCNP